MKLTTLCLLLVAAPVFSQAAAVDWSGRYRFEYTEVDKTGLKSGGGRKAYMLNHLSLSPQLVASDGFNVVSRFEILSNSLYPESQAGQAFGSGVNRGTNSSNSGSNSNVTSQNQPGSNLSVRELYLRVDQEFGQIVVGRAPVEFGLGMTYNAGRGEFDHWGDVHDLVGYKFLIGNLSMMPMIGKPHDYSVAQGREITDVMWNILYDNPETESQFGVFYRTRTSSQASNDGANVFDSGVNSNYSGLTTGGGWSSTHSNILLSRGWDSFKIRFEAGFDSGSTGLFVSGEEVKLNGYGIALEMEFPQGKSKWQSKIRMGMASGDNPTTTAYEGYHFDRNYDIGFLLFNHPLGQYDLLTSRVQRQRTVSNTPSQPYDNEDAIDEETVSNAVYFSPQFNYAWSDRWTWKNTLTYAQLQTNPSRTAGNEIDKALGWEWDTGFLYKPTERIHWVNEFGFFFPGAAFKGGSLGYENGFTYGFQSKVALTF